MPRSPAQLDVLQHTGLTSKEAKVYRTLLTLGEVSFAAITSATGSHPNVIYRIIESLATKGLVIVSIRGGRKRVRAEDPNELLKIEQRKLEELKNTLPELRAAYRESEQTVIRLLRGEEAIYQLRARAYSELKRSETLYIIGASGDRYYQIMGRRHASLEKRRIASGIRRKLVTFESQRTSLTNNDPFTKLSQVRFLPNQLSVPSSTNIFNDTVVTYVWTSDPAAIVIESPEIAKSYRDYFGELWRVARP
jgi:sugar-specific transcriptional regulator TrmB